MNEERDWSVNLCAVYHQNQALSNNPEADNPEVDMRQNCSGSHFLPWRRFGIIGYGGIVVYNQRAKGLCWKGKIFSYFIRSEKITWIPVRYND